jgi:hypothetical protein
MSKGVPKEGDRAAFDDVDYPELHARSATEGGGIHLPPPGASGNILTSDGDGWSSEEPPGVGASALDDLTDVNVPTPSPGEVLTYDGEEWVGDTPPGADLTVEEADETPSVSNVSKIIIPNGTLTDNEDGSVTIDFGEAATDGSAIHENVSGEIAAITEKNIPHTDDMLIIEDSEDTNSKKMVKVGNLPGGGGGDVTPLAVGFEIEKGTTPVKLVASDAFYIENNYDETGDPRGESCVDLQMYRWQTDQVADGWANGIFAGDSHKIGPNVADSVILGGAENTISDNIGSSAIIAGSGHLLDTQAHGATILGGRYAHATLPGELVQGGASFSSGLVGQAQIRRVVVIAQTNSATPEEMRASWFTSQGKILIPEDTTWFWTLRVAARRVDGDNESAGYELRGVIDNNSGTTALVGSVTSVYTNEDQSAWNVAVTVDNTDDELVITVTGEVSKTIRWVGILEIVQVMGNVPE